MYSKQPFALHLISMVSRKSNRDLKEILHLFSLSIPHGRNVGLLVEKSHNATVPVRINYPKLKPLGGDEQVWPRTSVWEKKRSRWLHKLYVSTICDSNLLMINELQCLFSKIQRKGDSGERERAFQSYSHILSLFLALSLAISAPFVITSELRWSRPWRRNSPFKCQQLVAAPLIGLV